MHSFVESPCVVSEWDEWGACSLSCGLPGEGIQSRTRQILKFPTQQQEGNQTAASCPSDLEEIRACVDIPRCRKEKGSSII